MERSDRRRTDGGEATTRPPTQAGSASTGGPAAAELFVGVGMPRSQWGKPKQQRGPHRGQQWGRRKQQRGIPRAIQSCVTGTSQVEDVGPSVSEVGTSSSFVSVAEHEKVRLLLNKIVYQEVKAVLDDVVSKVVESKVWLR